MKKPSTDPNDIARAKAFKWFLGVAAFVWLSVGGWAGAGCRACVPEHPVMAGTAGFIVLGLASAIAIGALAWTASAFRSSYRSLDQWDWDNLLDRFTEISFDDEDIALAFIVVGAIGALLLLSLVVGLIFSLI